MQITPNIETKIAETGVALAAGWNALAASKIIPSMTVYEETSLAMAFTRVITTLVAKLPDDE